MSDMKRYIVRQIGAHRNAPRVYLDIDALADVGFAPGKTYVRDINETKKRITLSTQENGTHVVSKKDVQGRQVPVIDINSTQVLKMFEGMQTVRIVMMKNKIHILPIATEVKRAQRLADLKTNLDAGEVTTAGISFGGGVLDHAEHAGFAEAGIHAKLAIANEIDEDLLNHAIAHNDIWQADTIGIAAPMQELVADEAAMSRLPTVNIFAAGIPCSGASLAGKSKGKLSMMEDHPHVGGLIASAIMVINRINPAVCLIENVTAYASSASAQILRHYLRDMGYTVQETTLSARDFGCLENRNRWFLVAATNGIDINLQGLAPVAYPVKVLGDVLEDIAPDTDDWRTFDYLKTKEVRDSEKGNSFAMQVVTPTSTSCPVLRKGYAKSGSTDPLLCHPTNPDLLRPLTVTEHSRIKNVPEHLVAGLNKTNGHALLGQGITYAPVKALFKRIGECLLEWNKGLSDQPAFQNMNRNLLRATG